MIRYKAERYGITVIEQEDSHTSKESFLDQDAIPAYGDGKDHALRQYIFPLNSKVNQ